ncbi:hypothetical protein IE53DRAFT_388146 [Violaceomyces palustris]|uniref:Uncharacterized protein n=1 Tax=Violaceomyces palustris TaxID=1673888 RepID=A0ACD0NUX6_9BASI|nr:hypothetical protein IE53DRAFT_388146 [Violaceomyces palustris]
MSDPLTSLELRLRFLNTLVHGQPNQVATGQKSNHLVKRLIRSNALLSNTVQGNAGLESFIHDYEKNLPFLLPSLAASPHAQGNRQSALASVTHESISDDLLLDYFSTNRPLDPRLQFQILLESEHDLALAAKDLEECSQLERKGVTGAGRLGGELNHLRMGRDLG